MPAPDPLLQIVSAAARADETETTRDGALLRMTEAEDTLRAIGAGEVDAFVVSDETERRVFTLSTADRPYRSSWRTCATERDPLRDRRDPFRQPATRRAALVRPGHDGGIPALEVHAGRSPGRHQRRARAARRRRQGRRPGPTRAGTQRATRCCNGSASDSCPSCARWTRSVASGATSS